MCEYLAALRASLMKEGTVNFIVSVLLRSVYFSKWKFVHRSTFKTKRKAIARLNKILCQPCHRLSHKLSLVSTQISS